MARVALGALLTLGLLIAAPRRGRAQDLGPVVEIASIDSDARTEVAKQLELRGYDPEETSLDEALRAFAADAGLESPDEAGRVSTIVLDALGAGRAVALRWATKGPRAPDLTADEIWRLNAALRLRELTTREPRPTVDADTLAALREFQRATGHPVQEGEVIERRWLFILGVATPESIPHPVE